MRRVRRGAFLAAEVELSPLALDPAGTLRRDSPRPWYMRQPGYDDEFDWHTVFYDVFRATDGGAILLGPPLRTLTSAVRSVVQTAFGVARSAIEIRTLNRNTQIRVTSDRSPVVFDGLGVQPRVVVQPNCSEWFRGKRVVFTVSKDNDLQWIRDWAAFYVRKHGCNAVLFYDNASSRYDKDDIHRTLSTIAGLETVVVVSWRYKFGPSGGPGRQWDSDFCQYGALEHARHRFLAFADACLNADVDELVTTNDRSAVFDRVLRSHTGFIRYGGDWVENVRAGPPDAERRHSQFHHRAQENPTPVRLKWAVVPARCPPYAQWAVHDVGRMRLDTRASEGVLTRHFRAINTNWKFARWQPEPLTPKHILDSELAWWLDGLDD